MSDGRTSKHPGCAKHPTARKVHSCRECMKKYDAARRKDPVRKAKKRQKYHENGEYNRAYSRTAQRNRKNRALGEEYVWTFQDELDAIARWEARGRVCYCGCKREVRFDVNHHHEDSAHLDRIENNKGYRPDNVEFLRSQCNVNKNESTEEDLHRLYHMVKNHREKNEWRMKKSSSSATGSAPTVEAATPAQSMTMGTSTASVVRLTPRATRSKTATTPTLKTASTSRSTSED